MEQENDSRNFYRRIYSPVIAGLAAMATYWGILSWKQENLIETLQAPIEIRLLEKYDLNENGVIDPDELTRLISDHDLEID